MTRRFRIPGLFLAVTALLAGAMPLRAAKTCPAQLHCACCAAHEKESSAKFPPPCCLAAPHHPRIAAPTAVPVFHASACGVPFSSAAARSSGSNDDASLEFSSISPPRASCLSPPLA
ncbi:MAG: hypothetical protein ACYCPQ_05575 [Elusimicrobiota bacterium]